MSAQNIADLLAAAAAATRKNKLGDALERVLEAWGACPASEIAAVIDAIGERAKIGLVPPTGKTAKARNEAWDEAAVGGDPVFRGVLLDSLTETRGNKQTLARLELLLEHPADPRVSQRIGDMIETPIYNAGVSRTSKFWKRLFELLPVLGDPRLLERARAWPETWNENDELGEAELERLNRRIARCMPALEEAYRDGPPPLSAADQRRCDAIISALPAESARSRASAQTAEDLLAAIYAAPDDDAPRLVYADFLLERGDPRGEFITLQMARAAKKASREQKKREKELLAEFKSRWFDGLPVQKTNAKFERGFLAACTPNIMTDDPAWATVREMARVVPIDARPMPALRSLTEIDSRRITELAGLTRPLAVEDLEYVQRSGYRHDFRNEAIDAFRAITVLPALRRLFVRGWVPANMEPEVLAWAWEAPCSANLDELIFPARLQRLPQWHALLAATAIGHFTLWGTTNKDDYDGVGATYGWCIELERDGDGQLSQLLLIAPRGEPREEVVARYGNEPLAGIGELPPGTLTDVTIKMPPSAKSMEDHLRARLAAALENQPASL